MIKGGPWKAKDWEEEFDRWVKRFTESNREWLEDQRDLWSPMFHVLLNIQNAVEALDKRVSWLEHNTIRIGNPTHKDIEKRIKELEEFAYTDTPGCVMEDAKDQKEVVE